MPNENIKSHILVVDDEEDLCEILRFNLETEGYAVACANSGEEAYRLLAEGGERFDLLLLDVMLEQMSGFDLARRLREDGQDYPIIFLTARSSHDDQLKGFDIGADDYIAKPFSFDTVLARIRAVLRRSVGRAEGSSAQEIEGLTRREYQILSFLQAHRGHYFTRQEILSAAWPDDTCVSERSVDVHIARLRKKMGSEGCKISNKSGFGYGMV